MWTSAPDTVTAGICGADLLGKQGGVKDCLLAGGKN